MNWHANPCKRLNESRESYFYFISNSILHQKQITPGNRWLQGTQLKGGGESSKLSIQKLPIQEWSRSKVYGGIMSFSWHPNTPYPEVQANMCVPVTLKSLRSLIRASALWSASKWWRVAILTHCPLLGTVIFYSSVIRSPRWECTCVLYFLTSHVLDYSIYLPDQSWALQKIHVFI